MMDKKKEMKLAYKENPLPMGVYQIKNNNNGKIFVASSMNIPGSFNSHRFQLKFNVHRNMALQEDWQLHGDSAFTFEILETIDPEELPKEYWREAVSEMEELWLENLQPYGEKGYNKMSKAETTTAK